MTNKHTVVKDFTHALGPPIHPHRIVHPRKKHKVDMRILVCDADMMCWFEDQPDNVKGWDIIEAVRYLRDHWPRDSEGKKRTTPIMLVCFNPHRVFEKLHKVFRNDKEWNTRFTVNTAERFHKDGQVKEPKVKTTKDIRISFFGFRDHNRKTKYFHPITPHDFMESFRDYGDTTIPEYIRLYEWGGSVRKWMRKNKLRFSPSRGGLSAQLLRDERFYPNSRRKVPRETNEKARPAMPGNFYIMREDAVGKLHKGIYLIDQTNAHHYAAERVTFPSANSLFARGRFMSQSDDPYMREKRQGFEDLIGEHGLFRCRVWVPSNLSSVDVYVPPWASRTGLQNIFLYSNELDLARELGVEIRHISYAWTSRKTDDSLATYAKWAQGEVKKYPDWKPWLKPTLLSAYGILGARPRHMEMAYWKSESGEPYRYLLGPTPIIMNKVRTTKPIQPVIANTIHRGMIEAETRKLSIRLARQLETEEHTVLGIHADAVLVRDEGQPLPLLPEPWIVKDRFNFFKSIDAVSWEADNMAVLPGRKRKRKDAKR